METRTRRRGHRKDGHTMPTTDSVSQADLARSVARVDRTRDRIKDAPDCDGVIQLQGRNPLDRLTSYSRIYGRTYGSGRL
jgi:hypothetical protein